MLASSPDSPSFVGQPSGLKIGTTNVDDQIAVTSRDDTRITSPQMINANSGSISNIFNSNMTYMNGHHNEAVGLVNNLTSSGQQLSQVYSSAHSQSAGQYEHITVMTNLHDFDARKSLSHLSQNGPMSTVVGGGSMHTHPTSAISQQVHNCVATSSCVPSVSSQNKVDHQRPPVYRNGSFRPKPKISAMLPSFGRGIVQQASNMPVVGEDGPTVRQHLQLQQQKARLHQQQVDDIVVQNRSIYLNGDDFKRTPVSPSAVEVIGSPNMVFNSRYSHIQRPYMPRMIAPERKNIERQKRPSYTAADAIQLSTASTSSSPQPTIPCKIKTNSSNAMEPMSLNPASTSAICSLNGKFISSQGDSGENVYDPIVKSEQKLPDHHSFGIKQTNFNSQIGDLNCGFDQVQRNNPKKRNNQSPSVAKVRVTMLDAHSEPAGQHILTASDKVLLIHNLDFSKTQGPIDKSGIALENGRTAQAMRANEQSSKVRRASRELIFMSNHECEGKNSIDSPSAYIQRKTMLEKHSFTYERANLTHGCEKSRISIPNPTRSNQRGYIDQNNFVPVFCRPESSSLQLAEKRECDLAYARKLYFLKRTIKALVFKNGALCDEVARLNQRIQTVTEERKSLAKRLQHHQRNQIRRIQTHLKKKRVAGAVSIQKECSPQEQTSIRLANVVEIEESDVESDKTFFSSYGASSSMSTPRSYVVTPEPNSRQEIQEKETAVGASGNKKCVTRKISQQEKQSPIVRRTKKHIKT